MDKDNELKQITDDLNRILDLFKKMESSPLEDIKSLKKESTLLHEELKKRYDEENPPETDSQEA